jgi:glycosyltransferase involved in cell wall biosynthesis
MHILAVLLAWPPTAIGGPIASAELLRELHKRGHRVTVMSRTEDRKKLDMDEFNELSRVDNGIRITSTRGWRTSRPERFSDVDVVYAHPDLMNNQSIRPFGWDAARALDVPLVYALHNVNRSTHVLSRQWAPSMYVWNSESTKMFSEITDQRPGVVSPPLLRVADHYSGSRDRATCVTLVNVSAEKGADMFFTLAAKMPDVEFLGVRGGYNTQLSRNLPNVTLVGPFKREEMPEKVWAKTRVLLMPSQIEAWGMSALEAACSGVPTLASPATGLVEALGQSGTFINSNDVAGWSCALAALLDNEEDYALRSAEAYLRAMEVERVSMIGVDDVERGMLSIIGNSPELKIDIAQRSWSSTHETMMTALEANSMVQR